MFYSRLCKYFGWDVQNAPTHIFDLRLGKFCFDVELPRVYRKKDLVFVVRTFSSNVVGE